VQSEARYFLQKTYWQGRDSKALKRDVNKKTNIKYQRARQTFQIFGAEIIFEKGCVDIENLKDLTTNKLKMHT